MIFGHQFPTVRSDSTWSALVVVYIAKKFFLSLLSACIFFLYSSTPLSFSLSLFSRCWCPTARNKRIATRSEATDKKRPALHDRSTAVRDAFLAGIVNKKRAWNPKEREKNRFKEDLDLISVRPLEMSVCVRIDQLYWGFSFLALDLIFLRVVLYFSLHFFTCSFIGWSSDRQSVQLGRETIWPDCSDSCGCKI